MKKSIFVGDFKKIRNKFTDSSMVVVAKTNGKVWMQNLELDGVKLVKTGVDEFALKFKLNDGESLVIQDADGIGAKVDI